ncbi:DUF3267 domain-containing protein [Spirosoma agri]|uniref:DUF3267 domain-containing protein n=1 Tax=Spirosoma agri TaxID=1987381 RepID=A0A6M0ID14_9BACT|nr:DUF3267 domain-containing protein [Spirosoma agri]NEU66028.1 DUF3267 domain-containing protein [Spirosoma agri]
MPILRPTVEQLHQSGHYELIESFSIDEMNQFLLRELGMKPTSAQQPRKRTWKSWLALIGIGFLGGLVGYLISASSANWLVKGLSIVGQIGVGGVAFFLVLPLHEFIHGLAFKRVGAPTVRYGGSLKNGMVYAYSQLFPATMGEVAFVAVMPFLVITTMGVVGLILWPFYAVSFIVLLLIHTAGCIGDFVLIRYYLKNRHRTIYTYDDVDVERRSYFFAEIRTMVYGI